MKTLKTSLSVAAITVLTAFSLNTLAQTGEKTLPQLGKNPVKDIVAAMTLEEKAMLVVGTNTRQRGVPQAGQPQQHQQKPLVPGAAGTTYSIPRLGIPAIVLSDGPAGLRISPKRQGDSINTYYCTAFPIETLLASTWDPETVTRVGKAMGNE